MAIRERKLLCQQGQCYKGRRFDSLRGARNSAWVVSSHYGLRVDPQTIEHPGFCPIHTQFADDVECESDDDDSGDSASSTDTKSAVYGPYHERKKETFSGDGTTRLSMSSNETQVNDGEDEREKTVIEVLEDYRDNE